MKELRVVLSGRLCDCPEPKSLRTELRGPAADPVLAVTCADCGAERSRPIAKINITYYQER